MLLWDNIKDIIENKGGKPFSNFVNDNLTFKIDTDDDIPLNKVLIFVVVILSKSVIEQDFDYYLQIYLEDEKMIEHDRIDLDEDIDVNKTSNSRERWLCHFWYFLNKNFNYQKYYCDGRQDMSMKTVSIKNLAIVYSKGNAYKIHF